MIALLLAILPFCEPTIVDHCQKLEVNTVRDGDCGERRFTQVILWRHNRFCAGWSVDKWKMAKQPIIRGGKCFITDGEQLREIRAGIVTITDTLNDPETDERSENNQRFEWNQR